MDYTELYLSLKIIRCAMEKTLWGKAALKLKMVRVIAVFDPHGPSWFEATYFN